MILDGVSYSAFIQYCRVILSRYSRTLLLLVFSRASTEYFCLGASIGAPVFPFLCNAVYTTRSTSSFQDSKIFPLARVYQQVADVGARTEPLMSSSGSPGLKALRF